MFNLIFVNEHYGKEIRVGTDCSGIEAPIQALKELGIPFRHVFSSEVDKYAIKSIKANYHPEIIFGDITNREMSKVPDIDLYVCGFPCQPFSQAGNRKGFDDNRGNVFFSCLDVIKNKKPKYFILENVKGLLWHDKRKTWNRILEELELLVEYNVDWKVLNTRDYGIPQNRERIFIVGIKKDVGYPLKVFKCFSCGHKKHMNDIKLYIDDTDCKFDTIRPDVIKSDMLNKIPTDAKFIDFSFKKHHYPNSNKYCPCISADSRMWCVPKHRYANIKELLSLQGFPTNFKQVVSRTQMKKQIGNSMSVNVLKCMLKDILN